MILSVRVNNFLVYSNEVELSLKANMHNKKFTCNVFSLNNFNVLKSICIYGANNSGKTCLIRAINSIRNVLLALPADVSTNIYTDNKTCSFGISFKENDKFYSYDYKYDSSVHSNYRNAFVYECLKELSIDKHGNCLEKELFIRDVENNIYRFNDDKELTDVLKLVSNDNLLVYTINPIKYPIIEKYKTILRNFASNIEIIDMNNIPLGKTINVLKNNEIIKEKTIELIKLADLDIDDFKYDSKIKNNINFDNQTVNEDVLKSASYLDDMLKLVSVHKGKAVQSIIFDSTGTKKMAAIASYFIDALEKGKTLVIDELDSSLHFKLTRALISLFNNELNTKSQLIFTAHDVTLLDCKNLFRKDQIWFASKDQENEYLYSLADFTANEDNVRSTSDLFEKYNSGALGAIPEPDLISVLLSNFGGTVDE